MYDFCVQKTSINQRVFYEKVCKIDRAGYKIFYLGKRDVLSVPLDIMLSLHIHLQSMMWLFLEKTGDEIGVLNTTDCYQKKGSNFFAVSSEDKMRSRGFKRQKGRLRLVIKGFFVPVSPGRDCLGSLRNPHHWGFLKKGAGCQDKRCLRSFSALLSLFE